MLRIEVKTKDNGYEFAVNWIEKESAIHDVNPFAFIWSAANGYIDNVKYLIDRDVNINTYNGDALKQACLRNKEDIVKLLLKNKAKANLIDKETINEIEKRGFKEIIKLLENGGK